MHLAFKILNKRTIDTSVSKFFSDVSKFNYFNSDINGWSIRIDNDLRLWTWGRHKKLMKVYDGQPLWTDEDTREFQQQQQQQQQ